MISIQRFDQLAKMASRAAKKGDLATVATINKDEELRSANVQFMVRDKDCYMGELDKLDRSTIENVTKQV